MEEVVIGACGVSAAEFEAMTPREVQWRMEAMVARGQTDNERFAQLACWVLSPFVGKSLKVSDFIKVQGRELRDDFRWLTN